MTMTMSRHGGVHEWDLTRAEVHEALYVSQKFQVIGSVKPSDYLLVVQCYFDRIRTDNPVCKTCCTHAIPPSICSGVEEKVMVRLGNPDPYSDSDRILFVHNDCEDLGM